MKRVLFFVVALMFAISSKAADVKVQTISVGEVTVKCADEAWKIDVKVAEKGGREEISVEMTAPQPLTPPQLSVEFTTCGTRPRLVTPRYAPIGVRPTSRHWPMRCRYTPLSIRTTAIA